MGEAMLLNLLKKSTKNLRNFALCWLLLAPFTARAGDPTVDFAPDDPEMNQAIQQARDTLDTFLGRVLDENGKGHPAGNVKVAFPVNLNDLTNEHIWVSDISWNGEQFAGLLANEPVAMPGFSYGSEVSFSYDMISDWSVNAGGPLFGHFTTRIVISRLPKTEQAQYKGMFAEPATPDGW